MVVENGLNGRGISPLHHDLASLCVIILMKIFLKKFLIQIQCFVTPLNNNVTPTTENRRPARRNVL